MNVQYLKKFSKDLDKIVRPKDRQTILEVIQKVKKVEKFEQVPGVRKLVGYPDAYRIRSGDYRIGVYVDGNKVEFARIAHRKVIYKIFP